MHSSPDWNNGLPVLYLTFLNNLTQIQLYCPLPIIYPFLFFLVSATLSLFTWSSFSSTPPPQLNDECLLAVPGEMLRLLKVIYVTNQALICRPSLFISVTAGHQCCGLWGVDICCFVILIAISGCVWVIREGGTGPWQYGHLSEREREREWDRGTAT